MTQNTTFSHNSWMSFPRSMHIKEDFLVSSLKLDQVDEALNLFEKNTQPEFLQDALERLKSVSGVYNDNVKYIIERINKGDPEFPDIATWEYHHSGPAVVSDWVEAKDRYENKYDERLEERGQLQQLATVCDGFHKRINALSNRIATLNQPVERIHNFTPIVLLKAPTQLALCRPRLRDLDKPTTAKPPVTTAAIASLQSSSAQAVIVGDSSAQLTSVAAAPSASSSSSKETTPSYNATIACNVGEGNVLGICCDTLEWGKNPIAFTATEKGWVGQIPTNVDYKIVVLKDGKVLKWEQGYNRKLPENSPALTLASNQIKF